MAQVFEDHVELDDYPVQIVSDQPDDVSGPRGGIYSVRQRITSHAKAIFHSL